MTIKKKPDETEDELPRNIQYGPVVHVPMTLMDAAARESVSKLPQEVRDRLGIRPATVVVGRPAFLFSDEQRAERLAAYREYRDRLCSSYKTPPAAAAVPSAPEPVADARITSYQQYNHSVTNAWRR
jgi:hypothetical protein